MVRRVLGLDAPGGSAARSHPVTVGLHGADDDALPLTARGSAVLRRVRLLGATGTTLMAIGALGAGAQPVLQNPVDGVRVLGLLSRAWASSLTVVMCGSSMLVLAWLLLGRFAMGYDVAGRLHRLGRAQLDRTLLLWILPLAVAPPMYSKDVYSYLAQSEITSRGLDPYSVGPAQALGVDHVLTRTVPNIWRDTPAPYGPFFLWIGKGITHLTGDNIVAGILAHRVVALAGVAMIVWALLRLARRANVAPAAALWLGAANPLLLFHLVAGVHNEALMIGLMLVGVHLALSGLETDGPLRGRAAALFVGGVAVIALSAAVKVPSLIALGFVGMAWSRRWVTGRPRTLAPVRAFVVIGAALAALAGAVLVAVSELSGIGMGWIHTLNTASVVRSWMSIPTMYGVTTGAIGVLLGIGDHTDAVLGLTRPIAIVVAGYLVVRLLVAVGVGRLQAIGGLGLALGAVVLLFPVVHPWYLLWAIIPLAAWATNPVFRIPAILLSTVVSLVIMPNGSEYPAFTILACALTTLGCMLALIAVTWRRLPWRSAFEPEVRDVLEAVGRPPAA